MILGVGLDLVDVARFARAAARQEGLVEALLTPAEIDACRRHPDPDAALAACFAAREALLKALGTGLVGAMSWQDVEVELQRDTSAPPREWFSLRMRGAVREAADARQVRHAHLSLAVTREVATAVVVLEGKELQPVKDVILEYIKSEYLDEEEAEDMTLDENTPLITSGIVDSFSMVSLKRFLEKKYSVTIPDDQATPQAFNTVTGIIEVVTRNRKGA